MSEYHGLIPPYDVEPDDEQPDVRPYFSDTLAVGCKYDSEGDTGVDSLIDYKDALQDTLDTIEGRIRDTEGMTLDEWMEAYHGRRV